MATNDELRAIAEAATPGPWHHDYWYGSDPRRWLVATEDEEPIIARMVDTGEADARYIATFDPRLALALLDVAAAARSAREADADGDVSEAEWEARKVRLDAALARLEALASAEPTTEAGKRLVADAERSSMPGVMAVAFREMATAIEAEARAAVLAELRTGVDAAWEEWGELTVTDDAGVEVAPRIPANGKRITTAVLALIDRLAKPEGM